MATVKEIVLAERLVSSLEASGQRVSLEVARGLKRLIADPTVTNAQLQSYVATQIVHAAGSNASLMASFLSENLQIPEGSFVQFAKPDFRPVHHGSKQLIRNVLETGSLAHSSMASGIMGEFVMRQVDDTQIRLAPTLKYTIKLNSEACKYCQENAVKFEATGIWKRHDNCRCLKVRL